MTQFFRSIQWCLFVACVVCTQAYANTAITFEAIQMQRQGLSQLIRYMDQQPHIFNRTRDANLVLNRQAKSKVMDTWLLYLDYMSTLNALAEQTENYNALSGQAKVDQKHLHALAFNAHYRFGLEFITRIAADPELVNWLNTEHRKQQLPKGFYQKFSQQLLSDWQTDQYDDFMQNFRLQNQHASADAIEQDNLAIADLNRFKILTGNSKNTLQRALYNSYFPLQKGVARGMGKVKVWRIGQTLIKPEQALEFSRQFEPGDFYLTRKEWRLTNVGIPGFWTHSAIYIGTPTERALYFNTPDVNQWVAEQGAESLEALLQQTSAIYAQHSGADAMGDIRVLEALDAGVIFNSIETSLDADGAAVFRPKTSKLEKAKALVNAFYYTGQPYDFHFDFNSDDAMVCSELIFKAYQASDSQKGIDFPLYRAVGKKMLTPSEIARWYDDTVDTPEQKIELVMFIDSNEKDRVAFQSTKEAFIGSWQRPDWYIFQQPPLDDERLAANQ